MDRLTFLFALCLATTLSSGSAAEVDNDGDGLSDFQEVHKYLTDPKNEDSDGDGTGDGDWDERREYTYTIRTVIKVMHPCNKEAINDDYQDARVLSETDEYVELEVVHYPFNTNAEAIRGCRDWKEHAAEMKSHLEPGITTNWDDQMRDDLIKALAEDGIDVDALTDKEVVEQVSRWLLRNTKYHDMFGTMFVHFPDGEVEIYPGLEKRFESENSKTPWPVPEHYQHELFGKGMFYTKSHGSCTSSAVFLTTVLRAVGIPTRMVIGIPVVDASDPGQRMLVEESTSHHGVRNTLRKRLFRNRSSFSSHTFNEVFVGGRWCRLNYTTLGDNTYGGAMGLLTHVHTFNDLNEAGLTPTWGRRYALGLRNANFPYTNPYRATEVSDCFGPYCRLSNPTVEELKKAPVSEAFWVLSEKRPSNISKEFYLRRGGGHVLIRVGLGTQDLSFLMDGRLDGSLVFTAEGHPPLQASAQRSIWVTGPNSCLCYVNIPAQEMAKMIERVTYRLEAADTDAEYTWQIANDVFLVGRKASPTGGDEPSMKTAMLAMLLSALAASPDRKEFRVDSFSNGQFRGCMRFRRTADGFAPPSGRKGPWTTIKRKDGTEDTYVFVRGKGKEFTVAVSNSIPGFDIQTHRAKQKLDYETTNGTVISLKRSGSVAYLTISELDDILMVIH